MIDLDYRQLLGFDRVSSNASSLAAKVGDKGGPITGNIEVLSAPGSCPEQPGAPLSLIFRDPSGL